MTSKSAHQLVKIAAKVVRVVVVAAFPSVDVVDVVGGREVVGLRRSSVLP
jgi:hypothetical protein